MGGGKPGSTKEGNMGFIYKEKIEGTVIRILFFGKRKMKSSYFKKRELKYKLKN